MKPVLTDAVKTEMRMAQLMAQQQASGFRFDLNAAERVRAELSKRQSELERRLGESYRYYPGKVFTPKRTDKKSGYVAGAPMTKLVDFNPTSRQHIAWCLQTFRGARFTKMTDTGKPKVDEATLSEVRDMAIQQGNDKLKVDCERFLELLSLQKDMGQLSEGSNSWLNTVEESGCIHHSCSLATVTGRNAHRGPNLGQVKSSEWARQLFIPHPGHVMVGGDLDGLELRCLGHYLSRYDDGNFAKVVVEGDIHAQNAFRVGCERSEVKSLTYAFLYGSGDLKLGHIFKPEWSDAKKKSLGKSLRKKFEDAIPGLKPLVDAVKMKVREQGRLRGLDGRPIFCRAEHSGLNFLLQSAGACLSKMWCIQTQNLLDEKGLVYDHDYTRCAFVHDEQQFSVLPKEVERVKQIIVNAAPIAGEYYNFRVPITASSSSGANWSETH